MNSAKPAALGSIIVLLVIAVLLWAPWNRQGVAEGEQLILYCAAGMLRPVEKIADQYEREYGVRILIEPDGSGKLLAKIKGAPNRGELYLAADPSYIIEARQLRLVAESVPVAQMRPVLVVNSKTQQQLENDGHPIESLDDLLRTDISIALANPELASIGKLTKQLLTESGHWSTLEERMRRHSGAKVSTLGTVTEVAQTVRLKTGYVGIVWDSVATQYDGLDVVHTDQFDQAIQQITISVLTNAKGDRAMAALQFARYLTARDKGLTWFEQFNFEPVPDADTWAERPAPILMSGAMLKPGIDQIVKAFGQREGVTVRTNYNGCGILVSQMESIQNKGLSEQFPDAYFSCDINFMNMVQQWFDAASIISNNDIVMIVGKDNPLGIRSQEDLARTDLTIGFAHPENSALGALTDDLLKQVGLHPRVYTDDWRDRIVHADAGHDLVNKLRAKALDLAVVYRSNAKATPANLEEHMDIVEIDVAGALAEQPFAIAADSDHKYLMKRLLQAIVAEQSQDRFRSLGFQWVYTENP